MTRCASWAALASAAAVLGACGGDDEQVPVEKPAKLTGANEPVATRVVQRYVDAYFEEDAKTVCRLVANSVREQLDRDGGCLSQVERSFELGFKQDLTVDRSYRDGDTATATFKKSPRRVVVQLQDGEWRVIDGGS